jgi:lipoate synthase
MISQRRISICAGEKTNPEIVQTFEDLRNAAEEWRTETDYIDPPTRYDPEEAKFPNRKELKAHTLKAWGSMGWPANGITTMPGILVSVELLKTDLVAMLH